MKTTVAMLALALAAAACSSIHVSADYDRDVDFTALRTFAWRPPAAGESDGFGDNTLVKKRVAAAIERELAAKGFSRADRAADLLISTHASARERVDVTTWPSWGWGWSGHHHWGSWDHWGWWDYDRVEVSQWTEGSLVVDFVNPATKELIWRGVARAAIDSSSGSPERVDEAIHKLLEGFPPNR